MKSLKEIVEGIDQYVEKLRSEFIAKEKSEGKPYPNWGEFKHPGVVTLLEFCKKHGYEVNNMNYYIHKLYELNDMAYTHMTVTNSTYLNADYENILLEVLGKFKFYNEQLTLATRDNNVPLDIARIKCPVPSTIWDENDLLFKSNVRESVSEIKSWISIEDVAKENNLDLEATLIAGERIVGRIIYEKYDRSSALYEKTNALKRRVVNPMKARELINDSHFWVTVRELSTAINVSIKRVIETYKIERRKQIKLYPLRDNFDENSVISEMEMIEKIILIETKINPFRNYLEEEIMESKLGTVANPPNSVLGKYLAMKGRKGHGHF
ncbi:hypothetical protein [Candidatus Pristimantibacillus sp. PTI5]|uniref:hypothetical protein n=1 Tax=Candidatus Pristimantibacillus sp. PTI5 TaxID=3400422 RepID=UPI003B013FDC